MAPILQKCNIDGSMLHQCWVNVVKNIYTLGNQFAILALLS